MLMYRDSVRITSWVLAVGALSLAVACGKKQPPVVATPTPAPPAVVQQTPVPTPPPAPPPPPPSPSPVASTPLTEDEVFAKWSLEELQKNMPLEDVLFAYDSAELSEAGR